MWVLGSPAPVEKTLFPAIGDRPPVTVSFNAKPSPLSLRAARLAAAEELRRGGPQAEERAGDAFTAAIIRHNITGWSGIGDADGNVVEPTHDVERRDDDGVLIETVPGTISAMLAEPRLVEAADREYVLPWALADAEKNGLSLSPNGISAGATPAPDTASSVATPRATAVAATKRARRRAPTKSTGAGRTKAKRSGS